MGREIETTNELKYLGLHIDRGMTMKSHITNTCRKAEISANALNRIMPNINGPTQRKVVTRICSAYRTISTVAALVISGTPPIRLQIEERARTYGKDEDTKRKEEKEEKEETIRKWQREWEDTVEVGQWTKRLIPNVATWTNRKHGNVDYYLTQMLSGHGCFAAYLHKFALIESDICWYCQERDDAAHTFLHCIRWTRERTIVETAIGETLSTENITNTMIDSKEGWDVIAQMAKGIISKKEEEERTRKRQLQGQE
ncbi:hypothetical protein NQ318_018670 [Aromia moschata]|uniref:Reverse transcriptase n=1 Tax=Aromia moschata TaxID=1265417 RepID=A0AAV8ZFB1_9CUCU|nr:hypothetical protein NQ318_018670 [Aromia moschata]